MGDGEAEVVAGAEAEADESTRTCFGARSNEWRSSSMVFFMLETTSSVWRSLASSCWQWAASAVTVVEVSVICCVLLATACSKLEKAPANLGCESLRADNCDVTGAR